MLEILKDSLVIIGVIIGAGLQYFFSKKNETKKHKNLLKTNAYTDFLKAVSGISITQNFSDKEGEMEYLILLSDAKSRIAVYGSSEVIKKIADFWRIGPVLNNPKSNNAYTLLVSEMRKDSNLDMNMELNDLSQLLLSTDIE